MIAKCNSSIGTIHGTTGASSSISRKYDWREGLPLAAIKDRVVILDELKGEVSTILFGRLYYNLEAAGLGRSA